MVVFINNKKKELQNQTTLQSLVFGLKLESSKGIAIAVNQEVIPKANWDKYQVQENDKVTIIRATQGG
jgi:sulfur carrier protein